MHTSEEGFRIAILGSALLLGFIILVFSIAVLVYHRKLVKSYKAMIKAEVSSMEIERKRIAHDLHDELGPSLSAIRLHLGEVNGKTDSDRNIIFFCSKKYR